ncbi:MAG: hypothetical protein RJA36_3347 [Pseudomonadota bacterium]|jgi:alkyl hydroperoxide reductase subunit AhpC
MYCDQLCPGMLKPSPYRQDALGRVGSARQLRDQSTVSLPGEVCSARWKEGAATLTPLLDLVGKI